MDGARRWLPYAPESSIGQNPYRFIPHGLSHYMLEYLDHSPTYLPCIQPSIPCLLASSLWAMGTNIHGSHTHRSSCFLSFSTAPIEIILCTYCQCLLGCDSVLVPAIRGWWHMVESLISHRDGWVPHSTASKQCSGCFC